MIKSMLHIGKILQSKLRLSFGMKDRHENEELMSTSIVTINVNEEYKEAFRTKSYTDICNKVQGQLETRLSLDEGQSSSSPNSSTMAPPPSSPHTKKVHLLEYLVEPRQETLISLSESSIIGNYFDISQEAGRIYELILQNIYQVRAHYHAIRNVIKLIEHSPDYTSWSHSEYKSLLKNLTSFYLHSNPFSEMTQEKFHELHDSHARLLHRLTSQCGKTKRRTKFIRCMKRALADEQEQESNGKEAQVDITARGLYTLIKDMDTMSRMVKIVHDEMDHKKYIAEICVIRKGKNEILKEILQMHEPCFQEELEKHVYLSFLNINRLRSLLLQQLE